MVSNVAPYLSSRLALSRPRRYFGTPDLAAAADGLEAIWGQLGAVEAGAPCVGSIVAFCTMHRQATNLQAQAPRRPKSRLAAAFPRKHEVTSVTAEVDALIESGLTEQYSVLLLLKL